MTTDFEIFAAACRQNTGAHFLDSGSAYGRHHEKPPISEDSPACWIDDTSSGAIISTPHFLATRYEVAEMNDEFEEFLSEFDGTGWEAETAFMEKKGFVQEGRGNTCNGETDLSQEIVWAVWVPECMEGGEWVCADWELQDKAIITISVHTGCDIRGGYATPILCKTLGDTTVPYGVVADWGVIEARDTDGDYCTEEGLSDSWGNDGYPFGAVESDVKRWFDFTLAEGGQTVCALLNCGTRVKIGVMMPYNGE